jgi:CheY-like chemotaxis protein
MEVVATENYLRFILIDDNPINHFIVTRLLRNEGLTKEIQCFSDAQEALLFLTNDTADELIRLILLDISLPGMDGFEFLEALLFLPEKAKRSIRVVMLSSSYDEHDIMKSKTYSQVLSYINKPLTSEKLAVALQLLKL